MLPPTPPLIQVGAIWGAPMILLMDLSSGEEDNIFPSILLYSSLKRVSTFTSE